MAQDPRAIVKVEDFPDKETPTGRKGIPEFIRRRITRADGSYETFEYDPEEPPPPDLPPDNPAWGRPLPGLRGVDPTQYNAFIAAQKLENAGPNTVGGGPAGTLAWNPRGGPQGTGAYEPIQGTQPTQGQGSWQGGVYYGVPGAPVPEALTSDPLALEDRTIAAQQRTQAAQLALENARRQDFQLQMNAIAAAERANEIDAKRAAELRDYAWKTQVEFPEKLRQQEDVLRGNAITAGTQAGAAAVSDATAMLPYRYSPGFGERRSAALEAAGRGDYRPQPIAQGYTGPDLRQVRQGAESQYRNQYLQQFGFDPQQVANQVGYRAPGVVAAGAAQPAGASGAPAITPSSDDEEYLKQLAQQLAGQ